MPQQLDSTATPDIYAGTLAKLAGLSRNMLLAFRLEVGQLILDDFFGGSANAYRDRNPQKESTFVEFTRTCHAELTGLGLSTQLVRQCVQARIAWDGLPAAVREQLPYSHVVELSRLPDPTARARLAMDTTQRRWNVDQLKDAIGQARIGNYYDTDSATPGTQAPPRKAEPTRGPQPGRLVTRLEKAATDLDTWQSDWSVADPAKLRGAQRDRLKAALAALKAKVAALEGQLG